MVDVATVNKTNLKRETSESVAATSGRLTRTAERRRARTHVTYEHEAQRWMKRRTM